MTSYNLLLLIGAVLLMFSAGFYPTFITKRLQLGIMFLGISMFWLGLYIFVLDISPRHLFITFAQPFVIGTYLIMLILLVRHYILTYRTPKASS